MKLSLSLSLGRGKPHPDWVGLPLSLSPSPEKERPHPGWWHPPKTNNSQQTHQTNTYLHQLCVQPTTALLLPPPPPPCLCLRPLPGLLPPPIPYRPDPLVLPLRLPRPRPLLVQTRLMDQRTRPIHRLIRRPPIRIHTRPRLHHVPRIHLLHRAHHHRRRTQHRIKRILHKPRSPRRRLQRRRRRGEGRAPPREVAPGHSSTSRLTTTFVFFRGIPLNPQRCQRRLRPLRRGTRGGSVLCVRVPHVVVVVGHRGFSSTNSRIHTKFSTGTLRSSPWWFVHAEGGG